MGFLATFALKALKTKVLKTALLTAAELLAERTDTEFDDTAVKVVKETLEIATLTDKD